MSENSQLLRKENSGYEEIYPLSFIQNIIDVETKEKLSDILIRYNHIYVPWQGDAERTRLSVPKLMRRKGLWISYDKGDSLYTEYFKSSTLDAMIDLYWKSDDNWEIVPNLEFVQNEASKLPDGIVTPEKLSPALQELIKQNNTITNLPDDEDLEEKCNVIKFKDREYNPYMASGKGYKILRKNWVGGYNTLTQDMVNKGNTVYEIRYDFDLRGKEITIPEGCTLKFEGGSFKNGTIKGNDTIVIAGDYKIFNDDISIAGNFIAKLNAIWIGAKPNDETFDNSEVLIRWWTKYAKFGFRNIVFPFNTYYFNSQVQFTPNVQYAILDGNNSTFISKVKNTAFLYFYTSESYNENCVIKDITLRGSLSDKSIALFIEKSNMWTVSNVKIWSFEYGVKLKDTWYGMFDGYNTIRHCRVAITTEKGNSYAEINGIDFRNIKIDPCTIDEVKELYPSSNYDDTWYIKYGRCGLDAYTSFLDSKFDSMSIEGCDYAMKFNRIPRNTDASYQALINITKCYFENNQKYDLYFGQGATESAGFNMAQYIVNVDKCLFNSGNIHVEEGIFSFTNNGGLRYKLNIDNTYRGNELTIYTDTNNNYIGNNWVNNRYNIHNVIKRLNQDNFSENPYQSWWYQRLQNGLLESYIGGVPTNSSNVYASNGGKHREVLGVTSIFGKSLKFEDYFFRNGIGFGTHRNNTNENTIAYPSGNILINKPHYRFGYNMYSKGKGIPFYILYKYFTEGTEYQGYVQEIFDDEIYIDHETGTIKKVEDDSIVGYGKKYALTKPTNYPNGKTLYNVETGKANIYISALSSFREHIDFIKGFSMNSDIINDYSDYPNEVQDSLPTRGLLNAIILLTTDQNYYIYNGYEWVLFDNIKTRFEYVSYGDSLSKRQSHAEIRGQTFVNTHTGITYTYLGVSWSGHTNWNSTENWAPTTIGIANNYASLDNDYQAGDIVYLRTEKRYVTYNGTKFVDWDGSNYIKQGTTQQRPTTELNVGFRYFDTTLGRPIFWSGTKWVDATGAEV